MKFKVGWIDYDALSYIRDYYPEASEEEIGKLYTLVKKFARDGEVILVEFDTDTGTATVLEVK